MEAPEVILACATCFGTGDNQNWINAFYAGGALLLLTVFSILGVLVRYIIRTERAKSRRFKDLGLMDEGPGSQERWPL